jgi:hypothetical protein
MPSKSQTRATQQSLQIINQAPIVAAMRVQKLMNTHPGNWMANMVEAQSMVGEKMLAVQQAQMALWTSAWRGNPWLSLSLALEPMRSKVASNHRRLSSRRK